jgi:hypothetical protein
MSLLIIMQITSADYKIKLQNIIRYPLNTYTTNLIASVLDNYIMDNKQVCSN